MKQKRPSVDLSIQRATVETKTPGDEQFREWVETVLAERHDQPVLCIRLVDEEDGRRFNREFRDKDYATNILSFPAELPPGLPSAVAGSQLGDLLICAPVVIREAKEQGKAVINHWAHLTIHGLLHLLGYDHEQLKEATIMEQKEIEILDGLGIADPYQCN
jgi:probable rRNA maturation factor